MIYTTYFLNMQGARDHIDRLEGQVRSLEGSLARPQATMTSPDSHAAKAYSELARMRAELADAKGLVTQLQHQLQEEQAEVLMLKESQRGSNKASDVIRALESQVGIIHQTSPPIPLCHGINGGFMPLSDLSRSNMFIVQCKLSTQLQ